MSFAQALVKKTGLQVCADGDGKETCVARDKGKDATRDDHVHVQCSFQVFTLEHCHSQYLSQ
jgi:hypothetical protein